jgi:glycosyltransferase involved in cell wall biosynthesis
MKKLSVITPVYNEEEVIAEFHRQLAAELDRLSERYESEVIYIVDSCPDRSLEILRGIAQGDPRVKVLALSARFGHQMALVAGIDHAHGDAVIMLDSDLQHPPALIPVMLAEFEKGYDVVFTIRKNPRGSGLFKSLTSGMFYAVINRLSQIPILESAADFRLISARIARVFQREIRERNQFLRGLVSWVGFKRIGIPFETRERGGGRTKYSIARLLRFGIHGIVSFSKKPLEAAILVGLGLASLGLFLALFSVIDYFHRSNLPSGFTTLVILISGFSGVHLIFLGIIGEYVGAIFDEVKARPHYIIEEKLNFPSS